VPTPAPDWDTIFADPTLPLQVDVGSGSGRFVLIRALRAAGRSSGNEVTGEMLESELDMVKDTLEASSSTTSANVLGLEIRQKLVDRAQAWAERLQLKNCRFLFTNATVSWKSLLESYPGPIDLVTMQFPDPHFKSRHHKRRHVQPQLVREIGETLAAGARVFLQGDVPEAVRWMRDMFDLHGAGRFALAPECRGAEDLCRSEWETPGLPETCSDAGCQLPKSSDSESGEPLSRPALRFSADADAGWLSENPLGVPTEREVYVAQIEAPVYRVMLVTTRGAA